MREKAVRFGKTKTLVGIVTEASNGGGRDGGPAVILLNSGILHHVGACRLHVKLARTLAPAGYTVMRFDHSGIGDSDARRETLSFEKSAVLDVQEAMDYLTATRGAREFVLMGLCSGADMSFKVASADSRVVGMMQLDAWAYRTLGYWLRHYGNRVLKLSVWKHWLRRKLTAVVGRSDTAGTAPSRPEADAVTPEYRRVFPPRDVVAADLRTLLQRGVRFFNVFSGGQGEHYNHRAQYARSFREIAFGDQLRVEYIPTADHLFTALDDQAYVAGASLEWMRRWWPSAPSASAGINPPVSSHAPPERSPAFAAPTMPMDAAVPVSVSSVARAQGPEASPAPPRIEMRHVGKHALIYGLGIVLSRAVSFIMLPIYTRYLTPSDYGVMELISMTLDVISMIAGAQLAVGIFRYYHKAQHVVEKNAVVSTALFALAVSYSLVGTVAFLGAGPLSSLIFRSLEHAPLIRIAAVGFAAQGLMIVPLTYARARDRSTLFFVANAVKLAIGLGLNLLLVVHFEMGVKGVLISNLIAAGVVGVWLTGMVVRDVGLRFSRDATRDLLRYGIPMIGTWLAAFISTYADRYFLQATGDTAAVGLYSLAYTFGFILTVLGQVPFMQIWESKRFEIARLEDRDMYLAKGFVYLNLLLLTVAVGIALFVGDLLRLIASPAFFGAARIVPLILIAYVFQAWTNAVEIGILVRERTGLLSLANWIAAAVALVLYAVLIPRWLGFGAAIATVVAFAVRLGVVYWMSQRLWPVRYQWRPVIKLTLLALLVSVLGAWMPSTDPLVSVSGHALLGAIYLVATWKIGVLSAAERAHIVESVRLARTAIQARVMGGAVVPQ